MSGVVIGGSVTPGQGVGVFGGGRVENPIGVLDGNGVIVPPGAVGKICGVRLGVSVGPGVFVGPGVKVGGSVPVGVLVGSCVGVAVGATVGVGVGAPGISQ